MFRRSKRFCPAFDLFLLKQKFGSYLYPTASIRLQVFQKSLQDSHHSKEESVVELIHANFEKAKTEET
jgi:hypothetical protein